MAAAACNSAPSLGCGSGRPSSLADARYISVPVNSPGVGIFASMSNLAVGSGGFGDELGGANPGGPLPTTTASINNEHLEP
jgi:hypothetical protein